MHRVVWLSVPLLALALAGCLSGDPGDPGTGPPVPTLPPLPEIVCAPECNVLAVGVPTPTNEPHIVVNPLDPLNIVAGANDYTGSVRDSWVGYYWSKDGGKTWGRGLVPGCAECPPTVPPSPLTSYTVAGDAVLAFDQAGNLYLSGLATRRGGVTGAGSALFVAKSTDGGETFPQVSLVTVGDGTAAFHDKEWITTGPNGEVYIVWAMFTGSNTNIMFSRSTDGGMLWSPPAIVSEVLAAELAGQGAIPVVASDGTIHVTWYDHSGDRIVIASSTDGGDSWSAPATVAEARPIPNTLPNNSYRSGMLPDLAIDKSDKHRDRLYVTWNDYGEGHSDVLLTWSDDGGATWSEPVRVNDDDTENDQWMPAVDVAPNGDVSLLFYDRRNDPENKLVMAYYAWSRDLRKFTNLPLSTTSFDGELGGGSALGEITSGAAFMGDYQAIAHGPGFAIGIWADTRNSRDINSDLYVAKVRLP